MPTTQRTPYASESDYVSTADGVNLYYRDWGDGRPVVFAASWSLPSESWNYQMLAFCEAGYRCIAYDRRGHGRSSDPGRGYDYDTLADDLAALLVALDLHDVTLVGFSMGTAEIVRYLTRHGSDRVAQIVLLGTTTPFLLRTDDNPDGIDGSYFESFQRESLMRDIPLWIDENMEPFAGAVSPGLKNWVRDMALRASAKALLDCNRTLTTEDLRNELPRVTVPALVVHGDQDMTSPIDITGRRTAAMLPQATLLIYEGAPHGLFLTHMDRFNRDVLAFLRQA
jgi:pimeloyl-ACP methyl ester carboxylesterase